MVGGSRQLSRQLQTAVFDFSRAHAVKNHHQPFFFFFQTRINTSWGGFCLGAEKKTFIYSSVVDPYLWWLHLVAKNVNNPTPALNAALKWILPCCSAAHGTDAKKFFVIVLLSSGVLRSSEYIIWKMFQLWARQGTSSLVHFILLRRLVFCSQIISWASRSELGTWLHSSIPPSLHPSPPPLRLLSHIHSSVFVCEWLLLPRRLCLVTANSLASPLGPISCRTELLLASLLLLPLFEPLGFLLVVFADKRTLF